MKPRDPEGRYTYAKLDILCVCGHTLGQHAAGNGQPGVPRDCLAGTGGPGDAPNEPLCGCPNFRRSRKRT